MTPQTISNIGFISTRFQGTDGVSLETEKWVHVLEEMGYNCFFFAGQSDWDPEKTIVVEEAFFDHPEIKAIQEKCFGCRTRTSKTTGTIHNIRREIKKELYEFQARFNLNMVIVENASAIPMNIPLGLAVAEFIAETGIAAIGHHHDFRWERQRFTRTSIQEYLSMAFPPHLPTIKHVVINTQADRNLSYRKGLSAHVIPNVFNYEIPPPGIDDFNKDVPEKLGLKDGDIMFLQPTRVVARKGIEHAIETIYRLKNPKVKLVITHQAKDEGRDYYERVVEYAKLLGVELIIKPELFAQTRGYKENGDKVYSLWDVYPHAHFVTYPSTYEGFGNAFLEAVYFKKPIMVNRYAIYEEDIEPYGFNVVTMDTYITEKVVNEIRLLLDHPEKIRQMVEKNYKLAARFFSYNVLKSKLEAIFVEFQGA